MGRYTKADYAQRMISHMSRFFPNLPDVLLAWHCDSPVDMERTSPSFRRGDLHGIAMPSYQLGAHRPTPELGQFVVPGTAGLYLVGPSSNTRAVGFWVRAGRRRNACARI